MIRLLIAKFKPANSASYAVHLGLLVLLPLVIFILVRAGFPQLALSIVLLSKWRMFAVRPRFWPAIVRANAVDIMVGLSIVLFMVHASTTWWQLLWAVAYGVWLISVKPASNLSMTTLQAMIGQLLGLSAVFLVWSTAPLYVLVLLTGVVCYLAARHFFDGFDESYSKLLAYLWGYFGAALAWLLGHWLLFYAGGLLAQPTLLLCILGFGLAGLYFFDHQERLNPVLKKQFIAVMLVVLAVILTFSDWGDKVV